MELDGWRIFVHPVFEKQLEKLTRRVERLEARDPKGYAAHPETRILASLNHLIREAIPAAAGEQSGGWLHIRFHQRYRLFYRVAREPRVILYAWIANDHNTRSGAYGAFRATLERGDATALVKIPS